MSIGLLFEKGFESYYEKNRDDGKALWFFLHIPKTAGSSFATELASLLRPQAQIGLNYHDRSIPFPVQRQRAVDGFIKRLATEGIRFAHGHIFYPLVQPIAEAHPDVRIVTMLRNPVKRVISDYRYQCTPAHPLAKDFMAEYPTFESYASSRAAQNKLFLFLAKDAKEPVEEVVRRMDREFAFVGLLEMYPLTFRLMTKLLGRSKGPRRHERKTETVGSNTFTLSDKDIATLRQNNSKDDYIFRYYSQRFKDIKDNLHLSLRTVN